MRLGHQVVGEATNGKEAIDQYAATQPDVILMDVAMPLLNGIEATRQILKINPHAKIYILSSMTQENLIIDAMAAGAADYIAKPFEISEIEQVLSGVSQPQRTIKYA